MYSAKKKEMKRLGRDQLREGVTRGAAEGPQAAALATISARGLLKWDTILMSSSKTLASCRL
jgi:hypothetical protein